MPIPLPEPSSENNPGAVASITVRNSLEATPSASTEMVSDVPEGKRGHRKSTCRVNDRTTGALIPFTNTLTVPAESELPSEVPVKVARVPGVHAATAPTPAALRRPARNGREVTTLMATVFVWVLPRELVAVNETAAEPRSLSAGIHSKSPEVASNVAVSGLFWMLTDTGNP